MARFKPKKGVLVGIDISKKWIDVCCLPKADQARFAMSDLPLAVKWVCEKRASLVVMEASGGYEAAVWAALEDAKVAVALVNALHVRRFAQSGGEYAKNDQIDARMLAEYGIAKKPRVTPYYKNPLVRALLTRYAAVMNHLVAEKNRLKQTSEERVRVFIRNSIASANQERKLLEETIATELAKTEADQRRVEILDSAPGIGKWTAMSLTILLPELGTLCRRKIAKLAGLAPFTRESGDWKGKRFIGHGRSAVRSALYMPTLVAIRHNPVIRAYYKQLLARGKPRMVAITACMRKLLTILNAMVRTNSIWVAPTATTAA